MFKKLTKTTVIALAISISSAASANFNFGSAMYHYQCDVHGNVQTGFATDRAGVTQAANYCRQIGGVFTESALY